MSLLTIFTSPKPFTNPHIRVIQRNAIRSWVELDANVQVLLLGDEEGLAENARLLGVKHIPQIKRNSSGTPLISSLFETARMGNDSALFAYINTDILIFPDFLETALKTLEQTKKFLLVGQRYDMDITTELDFSSGWQKRLKKDCSGSGRLHKPTGSDYFIYPRLCFADIPDFAIGRAGWDNWMIYQSRRQGWKTINATSEIHIIHQDHDYSHLPGGQPHYRLPETDENVRLAGGKRVIFTLQDVNWQYSQGTIKRVKLTWQRFWREAEIFPLVTLKSLFLGKVAYYIFHPEMIWAAILIKLGRKKAEQE